jgi:hypothetical protein
MTRLWTAIAGALALVALVSVVLIVAASGGGDGDDPATSPAPSDAPNGGATPPSPGGLPPGLAECYADQGYELESPADIHSAPQEVVEECFDALHQGGGAP